MRLPSPLDRKDRPRPHRSRLRDRRRAKKVVADAPNEDLRDAEALRESEAGDTLRYVRQSVIAARAKRLAPNCRDCDRNVLHTRLSAVGCDNNIGLHRFVGRRLQLG
jgi:hypothetical protein